MNTPNLVVDSSIVIKWLVTQDELNTEESNKLLRDLQNKKVRLFAPEITKYEVGNALISKKLNFEAIDGLLKEFYKIPLTFIAETKDSAENSLRLAGEYKITYYDASFLSLAQQLKADLVTENVKHQGRYKGKEVKVIPLKNYK